MDVETVDPLRDDLGTPVEVSPARVRRVVSLVPSLTESLALTAPELLVGATDWCTHPADLDVTRLGGTKNPRVGSVAALAPDLVLANEEENRADDIEAMRRAGLAVWVTAPRTLPQAFGSLARMLGACGLGPPPWLDLARRAWSNTYDGSPAWATAAVMVWRRPWMAVGRDTFAADLLARLGVANVFGSAADRYPRRGPGDVASAGADLVVLPDEPYAFGPDDGPQDFPEQLAVLVSGRHLLWYGPSLAQARDVLEIQLAPARSAATASAVSGRSAPRPGTPR
jgi:ABC-type Fe3+-hydroxamate transport system substrate-binding protein